MMVRIHHHQLVNPSVNYNRLSCFFGATYVWRGYFGADSNKFGPARPIRSVSAKYKIVRFGEDNSRGFGSYNGEQLSNASPGFHGAQRRSRND